MPRALGTFVIAVISACGSPPPAQLPTRPPPPPAAAPAAAAPASAVDPPQPTLRLPRNFVPTGYRARLAIDPAKPGFGGAIEITGDIAERSQRVWLHGRGLTVTAAKATQGDRPLGVEVTTAGEDLLALRPAAPLEVGPVTFAIDYTGTLDSVESTGAYRKTFDDLVYVQTQFESISARRVFPCIDEPDRKVPWQLTLDVPKDLVAVANTTAVGETALDAATKRVAFAPTRPLPSYLIAFGVGPYEFVDAGKTRSGTPIRIIALKGRTGEARWAAETTARIVELLEDYFGIPYPYDKLDQISRPVLVAGAMENAGLITYGKRLILHDPARITQGERFSWVDVAAHELAHQWFGDLVTTAWWDDIWLNEGFASWLGAKTSARFEPAWRGDLLATVQRETALEADSLVSARRVRQPIANRGDIFQAFDSITYQKGASILAMFERSIGPERFRDGVRAYLAKHRFGSATSADFTAAISEVAGRDVGPAFASFLDQAGAPVVRSELRCDAGKPPTVVLSQHRYVRPGSPAPAEGTPWRLPVCIAFDRKAARGEVCTELTTPSMELALDTPACPAWIFGNAGATGYYRASQPEAGVIALRDRGWKLLTPAERLVAFHDIAAFVETGEIDVGVELSLVPRLLAERHRVAIATAVDAASGARQMLAADKQPRLDAWIRTTFGPAARALSWQPGAHDDIDAERSRSALVSLVASSGDATLRGAAVKLARGWRTLDPAVRSPVLAAAVASDPATFDRLFTAWQGETDAELRDVLLRALAQVSDETRLRKMLALAFDPKLELRQARTLLNAGRDVAQRRVVDAYYREHVSELLARFPDNGIGGASGLALVFLRNCDAARRDDDAAFVRAKFGAMVGAERTIARGLESLDQCIAARARLAPRLEAWLAGRR